MVKRIIALVQSTSKNLPRFFLTCNQYLSASSYEVKVKRPAFWGREFPDENYMNRREADYYELFCPFLAAPSNIIVNLKK